MVVLPQPLGPTMAMNCDSLISKLTSSTARMELSLVRFPYDGYSNSPERVLHTKIPDLVMTADNSSITFLGTPDMSTDFKKYYDTSFTNHEYSRVIGSES